MCMLRVHTNLVRIWQTAPEFWDTHEKIWATPILGVGDANIARNTVIFNFVSDSG